jgi:hypothetical protein
MKISKTVCCRCGSDVTPEDAASKSVRVSSEIDLCKSCDDSFRAWWNILNEK